jgi:hypothetical protein
LPAEITGSGFTVSVTVAVFEQPVVVLVPVTVYVVVVVGDATGLAMFVAERPVAGLHEYVLPPVAFNVTELPAHMDVLLPALIVGSGFTVTVTVAVLEQPPVAVPVTVYVVVAVGEATGLAMFVAERPVDGDHT